MGATMVIEWDFAYQEVSIHAPVMGATLDAGLDQLRRSVSIHAPVMGATTIQQNVRPRKLFQSTRP